MEKRHRIQKRKLGAGFTLIEIIIVVALLMGIGAITVPVGIAQINRSVCRDRYDEVRSELVRARTKALMERVREYAHVESDTDSVRVSSSGPVGFDGVALSRVPPPFQVPITVHFEGPVCGRSIIINEIRAIL